MARGENDCGTVQLAGGQTVMAPLVAVAAITPGGGYFAVRVPVGSHVDAVQVLDDAGTVLETLTSPDPDPSKEPPSSPSSS